MIYFRCESRVLAGPVLHFILSLFHYRQICKTTQYRNVFGYRSEWVDQILWKTDRNGECIETDNADLPLPNYSTRKDGGCNPHGQVQKARGCEPRLRLVRNSNPAQPFQRFRLGENEPGGDRSPQPDKCNTDTHEPVQSIQILFEFHRSWPKPIAFHITGLNTINQYTATSALKAGTPSQNQIRA